MSRRTRSHASTSASRQRCETATMMWARLLQRAREAERRRALGGLAVVKAPHDLCCAGADGEGDAGENSYIEDERTHAGDGVGD